MKTTKYFVWAALTLALGACNDDQEFYGESKRITIEAGFGGSSRVATNGLSSMFEKKDAIGVYVWTGSTVLPGESKGFVANNVTNTFDGKNWTATPQMLWKDAETPHYFLSVYPQTDILTTTTYTLDPADQQQSDLLVAMNFGTDNAGIVAQTNPVPLAFGHVMAKLRVNLKFTEEFSKKPKVELVTVVAKNKATIDWQTATATATGDVTGIEFPALSTAAQGYACSYESVMVPQDGFRSVAIVIGGETYTFTSSQQMQLKKGTITTLNLSVGLNSVKMDDISILDWTYGTSISGYLNNIDAQITAINTSIGELTEVDAELKALIKALQDADEDYDGLIAALKVKDTELVGQIASLQAYVNGELAKYGTKDWANATFATLEQYTDMQTALAALQALVENNKTELTAAINTAVTNMEAAITASETSMKGWVNDVLADGYYTKAEIDGKIAALATQVTEGDVALQEEIDALTAALAQAESDLTAAYKKAIEDAIAANNGNITEAIAEAVKAAQDELQAQINAIEIRLDALEGDVEALKARIQSIRFLPEYSDGKVKIEPGMSAVELTFIVSPKEAAAIAADKVTAFIYHTQSRAVDAQPLPVTGVSGDVATGMLTVSVTPPAEVYWATGKTANIYIQINDGNNDIISEMIPAYYYVEPDYVTFSATSEQTLDLVQTKSQKLDEWGNPVYADDEETIPVLVANPYPGSGDDDGSIQYSVGNSNVWKTFTPESQPVPFGGDKGDLHLRGISPNGTLKAQIVFGNATPVACSGDIRTLVDWENYASADTRSAIFYGLFENCTVLTSAPKLPATTLAEKCYYSMFAGCTSLTEAPELKAAMLVEDCYNAMFASCTSLTSAPELPATTLVDNCYYQMFIHCTNLNSVTMLATDISATNCLTYWLEDVADTGTFTKAAGMTAIPTNSINGIPNGWTVKVKSVEQGQETLPGFNYVNGY